MRDPANDEAVIALRREVEDMREDLSSLQGSVRGVENSVADVLALLHEVKKDMSDRAASAAVAAVTEQGRTPRNRDRSRTRDLSPDWRAGRGRGGDGAGGGGGGGSGGNRGGGGGKGLERKGRERAGSAHVSNARSSPVPKRHPQSPRAHG